MGASLDPVMSTDEIDAAFEALDMYLGPCLEHIAKHGEANRASANTSIRPVQH